MFLDFAREAMTKINWKLFDVLSKCLVLLVIIGLACNIAWVQFSSPDSANEKAKLRRDQTAEMFATAGEDGLPLTDFMSGGWRFVKDNLEYEMYPDCDDSQFKRIPTKISSAPAFDHEAYIDSFRSMGAIERDLGDEWTIWTTAEDAFAQVLITHSGTVQAIRAKMHTANGVMIVESRPRSANSQTVEPLLPVFAGVEQTATKENDQGKSVATMLKMRNSVAPNLRDFWRSNGWDVRPLIETDFKNGPMSQSSDRHRCVKDDAIIDVTFISDADETVAVLTRFK